MYLVTFTEDILKGKLHLLCSGNNKLSFATPYFADLLEDGFQFSFKRFKFQYKMEFFLQIGKHKTLALVKIKQKYLVLICRQKIKIP